MIWIALLLTACKSEDQVTVEEPEKTPTLLSVYVYSPEHPIPTRGTNGEVNVIDHEADINTFQIWVFETGTNNLVAYHSPQEADNSLDFTDENEGKVYQLTVSDWFAALETKPNVDVYVVANIAQNNCGFTLDKNTQRSDLEAANTQRSNLETAALAKSETTDYFGLSALTTSVPDEGLPMAGVLRDEKIGGESPVYRIGENSLATVRLERVVSKVRFIFSREEGEEVMIDEITFEDQAIPDTEFLFLGNSGETHVEGPYRNGTLFSSPASDGGVPIAENPDPETFVYQNEYGAQTYEDMIASAVNPEEGQTPTLTEIGLYYLRESDKKIAGRIYYHVGDEDQKARDAAFQLSAAGDFSRNHSWIVYAYYGHSELFVCSVAVKDWLKASDGNHTIYNW